MKKNRTFKSFRIDALPLLNTYIEGCQLSNIFEQFVPSGSGEKIPPSAVLLFLLRNIMLSGFPLYKLPEWSRNYIPQFLGVKPEWLDAFNDDRIGRSLDKLFLAERSTIATMIALNVIKQYQLKTDACHNDSTTVTFQGAYHQKKQKFAKKPVALLRGFNKDHRPDLKQLIFNLVISGDGAVPIHYKLHDGNVTDDTTHRETWDALRTLIGRPDFIYVADSKLCTTDNMSHITGRGGKFITILPKTRSEYKEFVEWVQEHPVRGKALWYRKTFAKSGKKTGHYRGYESSHSISKENYRIIWIYSEQKQRLDAQKRRNQIQKVQHCLREVSAKINKYSLKKKKDIRAKTENILNEYNMQDCFLYEIKTFRKQSKKKQTRGRPCSKTTYKYISKTHYELQWFLNQEIVKKKANADGFFPLITNIKELCMRDIFKRYKYQPYLEKRHSYLKSVLEVAPVYLKTPERIEALLFLYYVALIIYALIERDMQKALKKAGIKSIPIYPEQRECRRPSAERILETFQNFSRHELWENGELEESFFDSISDL
ncbi:MAG: IS1634 family transposase, partial [Candidatus Omnitrophota bacterium]